MDDYPNRRKILRNNGTVILKFVVIASGGLDITLYAQVFLMAFMDKTGNRLKNGGYAKSPVTHNRSID